MRKFWVGVLVSLLIGTLLATTSLGLAAQPIRLVVNGREVKADPPPQMIGGRVFVPIRFVAEALGAKVEWDESISTVRINMRSLLTESIAKSQASEEWIHWRALVDDYGIGGSREGAGFRFINSIGAVLMISENAVARMYRGETVEVPIEGTTTTVRAKIIQGRLMLNYHDLIKAGFVALGQEER